MRWGVVPVVAFAAVAVVACSSPAESPQPQPQPQPPPSSPESGVLRGPAAGNADARVDVAFAKGAVSPPAGVLELRKGQRVKITVTSDVHQNIDVAGYPDKSADVDPGDPEDIGFTPDHSGDIPVKLRESGALLVTVKVS
ncbi:hypothetical protein [Amycolatopsis samaneae]|uniref:EfeO-type cupredoxin-like domain-containing protein n=1 Tax=Amycolatopsis samaneae TaxID=664691 RepID=A0ABW5GLI2_9PSEU